ncbi:MAG: hypothetical protein ACFE9R_00910 [Candidatus Hermodarchaeota archaeon]
MHINSHFAVGVIFASILNYFFSFSLLEFLIIILFSFICDFDVFFTKFALNHNHRMLISHSIIPALFVIIIGIVVNLPVLTFSGIAYSIHIIIDTFDWGTNFFFFNKKVIGLRLLISKEETENLSDYLSRYKKAESFFDSKYYNNKVSLGIEVLLFVLMIVFITLFALEYVLVTLVYFLGLYFHLSRHFMLKKIESQQ